MVLNKGLPDKIQMVGLTKGFQSTALRLTSEDAMVHPHAKPLSIGQTMSLDNDGNRQ